MVEKGRKIGFFVLMMLVVGLVIFYGMVATGQDSVEIGITQIVEHPALDSARQGFIDILAENGYVEGENVVYDYQNAQNDMSTANTIAQKFGWEKPDLILAIATPTAQAVANEIQDIPVLITAVTDPVSAGLVDSMEKPGKNITGTTDMTPIRKQLNLLLEIQPDTERVGIIYNAGETNSVVQVELAREICQELGLMLVEATADSSGVVYQAVQSLSNRVDALYVATDNTVSSAVESIVKVAEENDLPFIVGEEALVERGGLATEGISYYELGRQTGKMAIKILKGEGKPENMPIQSQKDTRLVINEGAAEAMGVIMPEELKDKAAEVY